MAVSRKLLLIKILHTCIWIFFNIVMVYLFYATINNRIDKWVWICFGCIFLEIVVLLVFKNMCPVTVLARKYSDSRKANFDIFLPNWLAKYNKQIYSVLLIIVIALLAYRLLH
jgi:hypothetical protein